MLTFICHLIRENCSISPIYQKALRAHAQLLHIKPVLASQVDGACTRLDRKE